MIKNYEHYTEFVWTLIEEADDVIRKELGLKKVNIKRPEKENR